MSISAIRSAVTQRRVYFGVSLVAAALLAGHVLANEFNNQSGEQQDMRPLFSTAQRDHRRSSKATTTAERTAVRNRHNDNASSKLTEPRAPSRVAPVRPVNAPGTNTHLPASFAHQRYNSRCFVHQGCLSGGRPRIQ